MAQRQNNIHRKMELQKSQIRSILSDFRKAKHKCISICEQINAQFKQKPTFELVQKEVMMKYQLLDVAGLVQLKNKLVKSLSQLFDLENQFNTQKQRLAARKQFSKVANNNNNKNRAKQSKNQSIQDSKNKSNQQEPFKQQKSEIVAQVGLQAKSQYSKQNPLNVPLYRIQDDSAQNKVQRISKYVASLKSTQQKEVGNMKIHSQDKSSERIKQILHQDPQYLSMKQQLQKYKSRQQQLEAKIRILQKKFQQKQKTSIAKIDQVIEETESYKIVKIYKKQMANGKMEQRTPQKSIQSPVIGSPIHQSAFPRKMKIAELYEQINELKQKRKDLQILQIQKQLQKQQYNVQNVVSRINSTLQNNQQKLRRLRQQRMRIFEKDQDIWSELQQL